MLSFSTFINFISNFCFKMGHCCSVKHSCLRQKVMNKKKYTCSVMLQQIRSAMKIRCFKILVICSMKGSRIRKVVMSNMIQWPLLRLAVSSWQIITYARKNFYYDRYRFQPWHRWVLIDSLMPVLRLHNSQ